MRSRTFVILAALALGAASAGPASGQRGIAGGAKSFCGAGGGADPSLPEPSQIAPVALAIAAAGAAPAAFVYPFDRGDATPRAAPLVGISHEYTCHVLRAGARRPELARRYCTPANAEEVLDALARDGLNVLRLYGVFNHGLAVAMGEAAPYPAEQPFVRGDAGWDLTHVATEYLDRLEEVVRAAYCRRVVVELTLLDPWDGDFASGPFAATLRAKADFLRPGGPAEEALRSAVVAIVARLARYPNLVWEVANEPDFAPEGITLAEIAAFERRVVADWIRPFDRGHLVMVNGHQAGAFGWEVPGVAVASAHYAAIADARVGALEAAPAAPAGIARAFNESKALGAGPEVGPEDVRAEAWEFLLGGGALFDAYSVDRTAPETQAAARQLGVLARGLRAGGPWLRDPAALRAAPCGGQAWCTDLAASAAPPGCAADVSLRTTARLAADGAEAALYAVRAALSSAPGAPQSPFLRLDAQACAPLPLAGFVFRAPKPGCWRLRWVRPEDGAVVADRTLAVPAGAAVPAPGPPLTPDAAFFARWQGAACDGGGDRRN